MSAADLTLAALGHVGNSVVVRGGLEVFHDRLCAALDRRGVRVGARVDAPAPAAPQIVQFFGSFYALEGAFRACSDRPRVVFPFLLHSDRALARWRPPVDRLRSRLPWSLLSARRRMLSRADLVIASSEAEGREAASFGARRVEVVRGGVDLEADPADDRAPDELGPPWAEAARRWLAAEDRCLAIGRFETRKAQLEVARSCRRIGAGVLFVGRRSPTEPDYLDRVAAALPARSGLWEDAPDRLVRWALARAPVHVLATRHETIGLVSLEAAATGCRPVAIDQATSREYLRPFGELAADSSAPALAAALRRALARGRLSPSERGLLEALTWDSMAARLIAIYRRLLASTG